MPKKSKWGTGHTRKQEHLLKKKEEKKQNQIKRKAEKEDVFWKDDNPELKRK